MLPDGYRLAPLAIDDAAALAVAVVRSREHLAPWNPVRPESFFTEAGQAEVAREQLRRQELGLADPWVLWGPGPTGAEEVAGRVTIQNIVRGAMHGGTLGYWVDAAHVRRGLATAMVGDMLVRGTQLGLHRLEAAIMVENHPSRLALERCEFTPFGLAPAYLFLDGAWRDHLLFQRLLHHEAPA